jgi:hypothetical protein
MSRPDPQQNFHHTLLSQVCDPVSAEGMKPAPIPTDFLQDLVEAPPQHVGLVQRPSGLVKKHESRYLPGNMRLEAIRPTRSEGPHPGRRFFVLATTSVSA